MIYRLSQATSNPGHATTTVSALRFADMCDQEVMREPICYGQRHWLVTLSAVKRIVFVPAVAALLGFVGIPAARADLCHDGAMKPGAGSKPSGRAWWASVFEPLPSCVRSEGGS